MHLGNAVWRVFAKTFYTITETVEKRHIREKLARLRQGDAQPWEQRKAARLTRLHDMLVHAKAHVPYWRELFAALRFDPASVLADEHALEQLPFLTKEIVREHGARLYDERFGQPRHMRLTGGSIGPAVWFAYDQEGLDWTAAANLLVLEWTGWRMHEREVHLSVAFPRSDPLRAVLREYCKCLAMHRVNIKTADIDTATLTKAWHRLRRVRPCLLQGHPSTVYALALLVERSSERGEGVFNVFESTGESLTPAKRKKIESVFGCRVFDRYGSAEFGVIAHETPAGRGKSLRVLDAMVWPESIPAEAGCQEIVLSGLTNKAMPLFRYRQGDLGEVVEGPDGWELVRMQGRVHDMVPIGQTIYPTSYIQELLAQCPIGFVENFQVVCYPGRLPDLRIVMPDPSRHEAMRTQIQAWWGSSMSIRFITNDQLIHSGWQHKRRYTIWPGLLGTDGVDPLEPCA